MTKDDVLFGYRLQLFSLAADRGASQACRLMGVQCLREEIFRMLPPSPDAPDWADSAGWSDTIITGDRVSDEVHALRRGEFSYVGRTVRVRWLEGDEAEDAWDQYFARPRP